MNQNFGEKGWRQSWQPHFDAYTGIAVPHDILEHPPGGDGGAEDEIMAMGGAWVIRGDNGYFQRNGNVNPPHVHMASDMPDIFCRILEQEQTLKDPGCTYRLHNEFDEDCVQKCVQHTWKELRGELPDRGYSSETVDEVLSNENKRRYTGWLRRGIQVARSRYYHCDTYHLAYGLFDKISKQSDHLLEDAQIGDILHVSINLKQGTQRTWITQAAMEDW
jgi:hypothetical protein